MYKMLLCDWTRIATRVELDQLLDVLIVARCKYLVDQWPQFRIPKTNIQRYVNNLSQILHLNTNLILEMESFSNSSTIDAAVTAFAANGAAVAVV